MTAKILTIDDQQEDLEILNHILKKENYEIISARNGLEALEVLKFNKGIDVIIVDRMMPVLDGINFIRKIREDERYCNIPVIMQTAADEQHQVMEGIEAGVFWYLTKPFNHKMLTSIIGSAVRMCKKTKRMEMLNDYYLEGKKALSKGLRMADNCSFKFKTINEAKDIAHAASQCFDFPKKMLAPCMEILVNAVEHGNLGITYEEKARLLNEGLWEDEIEYRLSLSGNKFKFASAEFSKTSDGIIFTVKDMGDGFDWRKYKDLYYSGSQNANGRGLYLAMLEFDEVNFNEAGNEVTCIKKIVN